MKGTGLIMKKKNSIDNSDNNLLKLYRFELELTQLELSKILRTSILSISRWENSKSRVPPTVIMLLKTMVDRKKKLKNNSHEEKEKNEI